MLNTFGASGMGVFPASESSHSEPLAHYAVQRLGPCEGVTEHFFAIGTEKKVQHPLVQRLLQMHHETTAPEKMLQTSHLTK